LLSILFVLNFDCDSHVLHYCRTIYSVTICSSWSFDNICWELGYGRCRVLILTQKSKSISNKTLLFVKDQRLESWTQITLRLCLFFLNEKLLFKFFCVCLLLKKLINRKYFPVKKKFGLVFRKVFSWKIWTENTFQKL